VTQSLTGLSADLKVMPATISRSLVNVTKQLNATLAGAASKLPGAGLLGPRKASPAAGGLREPGPNATQDELEEYIDRMHGSIVTHTNRFADNENYAKPVFSLGDANGKRLQEQLKAQEAAKAKAEAEAQRPLLPKLDLSRPLGSLPAEANATANVTANATAPAAPAAAAPGAAAPVPAAKDAKPATDAKPAADAKPADAKPADAKPADAKPADAKPVDAKPADAKAAAKPAAGVKDAKPAAAAPALDASALLAKPAAAAPAPLPAASAPNATGNATAAAPAAPGTSKLDLTHPAHQGDAVAQAQARLHAATPAAGAAAGAEDEEVVAPGAPLTRKERRAAKKRWKNLLERQNDPSPEAQGRSSSAAPAAGGAAAPGGAPAAPGGAAAPSGPGAIIVDDSFDDEDADYEEVHLMDPSGRPITPDDERAADEEEADPAHKGLAGLINGALGNGPARRAPAGEKLAAGGGGGGAAGGGGGGWGALKAALNARGIGVPGFGNLVSGTRPRGGPSGGQRSTLQPPAPRPVASALLPGAGALSRPHPPPRHPATPRPPKPPIRSARCPPSRRCPASRRARPTASTRPGRSCARWGRTRSSASCCRARCRRRCATA
jgi:hypothetical protein